MRRHHLSAAMRDLPDLGSPSHMLEIEFAEASDCGPIRLLNEDFVGHSLPSSPQLARRRGWIFVLADGVGGQERGEVASRLAVEAVLEECANSSQSENSASLFLRSIQSANTRVYETGHGSIASTLVACALRFDRVTVAHVGDSRCYLIRNGRPERLTRDHTVLNDQVRFGFSVQPEQRAALRSILTRSVGNNLFVSPEINEYRVLPGDLLLLCSDGLHSVISDGEIARVAVSNPNLTDAAQQLIAIANQRDGGDNVSVQLIRVNSVEAVGMYRGRPYRLH